MGFETDHREFEADNFAGVNLPRWGLKRDEVASSKEAYACKFTPLGFETLAVRVFNLR